MKEATIHLELKIHLFQAPVAMECIELNWLCNNMKKVWERRQLGFVTLNGNLAVILKRTHPPFLNGKGQFLFLKTKSSHSSGIVVYPPKVEVFRN